jgi:Fe-S cluster assembly protein SufD
MTQVAEKTEPITPRAAHYCAVGDSPRSAAPAWLSALRAQAADRFDRVGFPSTTEEEWRNTSVAPIARTRFHPAPAAVTHAANALADRYRFDIDAIELIFVNGRLAPKLASQPRLPVGVRVSSLAAAIESDPATIRAVLAKHATIESNPFVALNSADIADGALVHLQAGVELDRPIHLLFLSTPGDKPSVCHPRVLIIADQNAQASVVESYVGGAGPYFTNAVTEIALGQGARVDHCKFHHEGPDAFHVSTTAISLAQSSSFISHNATLGGLLTRNDLSVRLAGQGAQATLNGLVVAANRQHVDNHLFLDHAAANCQSHEIYKHVLADKSTGVFKGRILVRPGAQKTDAKQTSKSLLLSDDAVMHSQPALEIYADDVKCTHGSTTGPVDDDLVFYLQSRGISKAAAHHLLTYAFAADITRRIRVEPVRNRVEDFLARQHGLPLDFRITDTGTHDEKSR